LIRVVLNDRCLRQTLTGVGMYVAQLLEHLPAASSEIHVDPFVFTHLSRASWREALARRGNAPPARSGTEGRRKPWWMRRIIQESFALVFRMKTGRYDLYHEPNHVPVRCDLPTVTTVHDLSVLVHPQWHPADRVRWYETGFRAGMQQTRRFVAASEFTKREMVAWLGVPAERIHVTYQAPRRAFRLRSTGELAATRAALRLPERYFLFVGTLEPRKNVLGLLDAFSSLAPAERAANPLLIAGAWGWKADRIREALAERRLADHVRLLGYTHDEQLAALYSGCTGLLWPTLYEGFGLPPLEAMACGAPVVVSDVASLPEVVGDAGVRLDPRDAAVWAATMRRLVGDDAWRGELSRRGVERAAGFSWARCAAETVSCYRAALAD
jgi:alpha-1,3-rhamnosyl/mannosyltransferase